MKTDLFFFFGGSAKCLFGCVLLLSLILTSFASISAGTSAFDDVQDIENARQLSKQAEKLVHKGRFDEAEVVLRRLIAINPADSKEKLNLAYVLLKRQQNLNEAYNLAVEIAKAEPNNARAFSMLGVILLNYGDFNNARLVLNKAYSLDKNEPLGWYGAGMLDFYENRISLSVPKLEHAFQLDPNEPDYIYSLAQVLARAEKYAEAGIAYEQFLAISPINDRDRRARIKGLISFLRYLGGKQKLYSIDDDMQETTVPIELVNMRPVVEVSLGGKKEKFRFVMDTGSGISVISDDMATRLKMKPIARGGSARAIGGNGKFEIVYGFLKSLKIGDAKIENVPVYIRRFHEDNRDIDGYIGLSLISKFLTTVDYGGQTFTLTKKDKTTVQKFETEATALPLRLTSSGFLSGEVKIEGIESPLNFIFDTGASVSVISAMLANTREVSRFQINEKMRVVGAAGITENADSFLLPRVTFGSHTGEDIRAVALNLDIINETSGFQQAGILGGNFLKNYRLTFDFQNSKVTFVRVSK